LDLARRGTHKHERTAVRRPSRGRIVVARGVAPGQALGGIRHPDRSVIVVGLAVDLHHDVGDSVAVGRDLWIVHQLDRAGVFCLVMARIVTMLIRPGAKSLATAAVVAVLYALPVAGAILRWHLVASPQALIGDGAFQTQLAGDFVLHGIDPYGADYGRAGLAAAPWGESFPSPALHHLVTWPGQFLLPLPLQAISRSVFGWWDERVFLLVAAVAIWLLLGALFPGIPGRMATVAFFLVPGHS